LTKLGTYLDLKRIWNPIDFQGSRSQGLIFRRGDTPRFALPLFSTVQLAVRPKKKCMFTVMSKKSRVGRHSLIVFFFTIGKTRNSRSRFWYFIFEISGKLSFVEAVLGRVTQFFYLLCSQFRQKASGWINKTLLLIKQHIAYMNISRYTNIDKFVNIRYIFFTSPSGIQLIISASPNVEITSPGRWASGFFNPWMVWWKIGIQVLPEFQMYFLLYQ
jgi:hypothetical protein